MGSKEIKADPNEPRMYAMIVAARSAHHVGGSISLAIQRRSIRPGAVDEWIAGLEETIASLRAFKGGGAA